MNSTSETPAGQTVDLAYMHGSRLLGLPELIIEEAIQCETKRGKVIVSFWV